MRLYAMIQETGKPIAFHAGYHWLCYAETTRNFIFLQLNRQIPVCPLKGNRHECQKHM
jgi:hypothetical protein